MKRAQRFKRGSVVFDKRRGTWNFLQWVDGNRKSRVIGTLREFPNKSAAQYAAEKLKAGTPIFSGPIRNEQPTVSTLVEQYRVEKMPERFSTRYGYDQWLNNHILPHWGECSIVDLQARPVEL